MSKRKKSVRAKAAIRSKAQKSKDEKLFLKILKYEAEKERPKIQRKPSQQKVSTKTRKRDSGNINPSNRKGKTGTPKQNISKSYKKGGRTSQNRRGKTTPTAGKGIVSKRPSTGRLYTEPQKRGSKQIDFVFEKVRSVNKKIDLFKEQSGSAIKKELRKRGGKPPRGIIVTVRDKKGREKTEISPLDFVVNESNVQNFIADMLERMKADFMEWKDMEENGETDTDANPYADYNPDTIAEITIKFIV